MSTRSASSPEISAFVFHARDGGGNKYIDGVRSCPIPRLRGRGPEREGLVPGVGGAAPLRLRGRLGLGGPVRLLGLLTLPVVGHLDEEK